MISDLTPAKFPLACITTHCSLLRILIVVTCSPIDLECAFLTSTNGQNHMCLLLWRAYILPSGLFLTVQLKHLHNGIYFPFWSLPILPILLPAKFIHHPSHGIDNVDSYIQGQGKVIFL